MPTFTVHKFSNPEVLKHFAPQHLIQFLAPFREYLQRRGLALPESPSGDIDHQVLAKILMSPDEGVPREMVDALYHVHEMADEAEMDDLLALAQQQGVALAVEPAPTPADIAVQIWLQDSHLLRRRHAERYALRQKKFTYYRRRGAGAAPFPTLTRMQIETLQDDLDDWLEQKKCGRGSQVIVLNHGSKIWLIVRRGLRYRREGSIRNGLPSTEYYRPEIFDVLVYDPETGGLGMHADGKRLQEMYLFKVGAFVFDDPQYFCFARGFCLEPLVRDGEHALNCEDIDGIERVTLAEYKRLRGGRYNWTDTQKADDLFAAMREAGQTFPRSGHLVRATLLFRFERDDKPRGVTVCPPNIVSYTRNDDRELVESFLRERGFMTDLAEPADAEPGPVLENA